MTSLPRKRANGSGSAAKWNPDRKKWEVRLSLPDGKRTTLRADTERDVERQREKALGLQEAGIKQLPGRYTVGNLLDDWLAMLKVEHSVKKSTWTSYEGHVRNHLKPTLGEISLKKLTPADVRARLVTAKLAAGHSPRLVHMMRDVLRIALSYAESMDMVERNVAGGRLIKIKVPDNSRYGKALTYEQAVALLTTCAHQRNGPLFRLLVLSGMRLGEALALHWSDIDWPRSRLTVAKTLARDTWDEDLEWDLTTPKTEGSQRRVPLVDEALDALRTQQSRQAFERSRAGEMWHHELDFVFTNEVGEPLHERGIQDAWKRALAAAGLDTTQRIHDLRHTAVTYLHRIGIPMPQVMEIVGHSTLAMTQRYAHMADEHMLEEARQTMNAWWVKMREQHNG